jgi:serine/threonine protein kinase
MNLEMLRKKHTKLSFATTAAIGIQMINRIEALHYCGFIHRDMKP